MIGGKMAEAINDQINAEIYSAYLYLAMSAWFTEKNLTGFANWMYVQAQEEMTHAMKFYSYNLERGGHVKLPAVEGVRDDFKNPLEIFEEAYGHEQKVTARIDALMDMALAEKDHATVSMLRWFIDEQVEEEASASELVEKLKMIGDAKEQLLMLDKELSARMFVDATKGG
ncbi:MAG TPA: ferritin [Firmicutes bacterium]|nr:ferritin [Bacillota bacterium]